MDALASLHSLFIIILLLLLFSFFDIVTHLFTMNIFVFFSIVIQHSVTCVIIAFVQLLLLLVHWRICRVFPHFKTINFSQMHLKYRYFIASKWEIGKRQKIDKMKR